MAKTTLSPSARADMARYVSDHLGERLTYQKIDEICGTQRSHVQYTTIIGPLVEDGVLVPERGGKGRPVRGNEKEPIWAAYRIADALPDALPLSGSFMRLARPAPAADVDLTQLGERLTQNGFLATNPEAAAAWFGELKALSTWLEAHPEPPAPAIVEERSFEVFRNEKLLSARGERRAQMRLSTLVDGCGLTDALGIKDEPFRELVYYVPRTRRRTLSVLVVENHAPFVRVQAALARGVRVFFGRRVDGVVYGEGFKVFSGEALRITEGYFSEGRPVRYLYWGDIDRQGIAVLERLAETCDVEPLTDAYVEMIACAEGEELPPAGPYSLPPHMGAQVAVHLETQALETFMRVIALGLRIPQEAVPASAYDGGETCRRLTETLRTRPSLPVPRRGA